MNGNIHTDDFLNGNYKAETLQKGMVIDRYGSTGVNFLSTDGTNFGSVVKSTWWRNFWTWHGL